MKVWDYLPIQTLVSLSKAGSRLVLFSHLETRGNSISHRATVKVCVWSNYCTAWHIGKSSINWCYHRYQIKRKKNEKDVGAREIAQEHRIKPLVLHVEHFPALHKVPQILPAVIPEHRAELSPEDHWVWPQNKSEEEALLIQTTLYRCSVSAGGLRDRGFRGDSFSPQWSTSSIL